MDKQVVATNAGSTIDLIHNNNFQLVDTVDLSSKFSELSDYLEDYTS